MDLDRIVILFNFLGGLVVTRIGLVLRTQPKTIEQKILKCFAEKLLPFFESAIPELKIILALYIQQQINKSITTRALINGGGGENSLRGMLGIIRAQPHIENLISIIQSTIDLKVKKPIVTGRGIVGGFRLVASPAGFEEVLSSTVGQYNTEKGQIIEWLEWLISQGKNPQLPQGQEVILGDYEAVFDSGDTSRGRTREGFLMVLNPGSVFVIPSQHSGIIRNNFVTRALDAASGLLKSDIIKVLKRVNKR